MAVLIATKQTDRMSFVDFLKGLLNIAENGAATAPAGPQSSSNLPQHASSSIPAPVSTPPRHDEPSRPSVGDKRTHTQSTRADDSERYDFVQLHAC